MKVVKLVFMAAIAALFFASIATSCTDDEFINTPLPNTLTLRTDTVTNEVLVPVIIGPDTVYYPLPPEIQHDTVILVKEAKEPVLVKMWMECIDEYTRISYITIRTDYEGNKFPSKTETYSFISTSSAKGEALKSIWISNPAEIKPKDITKTLDFGSPQFEAVEDGTIVSVSVKQTFTQRFTQTVSSAVSMEMTKGYLVIGKFVFEFPYIEQEATLKGYKVASSPAAKTVKEGFNTWPMEVSFDINVKGACENSSSITNNINLLTCIPKPTEPKEIDRWISRYWKIIDKKKGETSAYLVVEMDNGKKDSTELGKFIVPFDPCLSKDKCYCVNGIEKIQNIPAKLIGREWVGGEQNLGEGNYKRTTKNGITTGTNAATLTSYVSWPTYRYNKEGVEFEYLIPDNIFKEVSNDLSKVSNCGNEYTRTTTSKVSYGYQDESAFRTNHTAKITYYEVKKSCK